MFTPRRELVVVRPALALMIFFGSFVGAQTRNEADAFCRTIDGSSRAYTLKNANGLEATITNYGGIVVSLLVPDKNGNSVMWSSGATP
jgi:hypothetical protein